MGDLIMVSYQKSPIFWEIIKKFGKSHQYLPRNTRTWKSLKENSSILLLAWKSLFFTFPWFGPKFGDFFKLFWLIFKIWEILDRKKWLIHPLNLGNLDLGSSVTASLKENSSILLLAWKSLFFTFPWFGPKFGDFF